MTATTIRIYCTAYRYLQKKRIESCELCKRESTSPFQECGHFSQTIDLHCWIPASRRLEFVMLLPHFSFTTTSIDLTISHTDNTQRDSPGTGMHFLFPKFKEGSHFELKLNLGSNVFFLSVHIVTLFFSIGELVGGGKPYMKKWWFHSFESSKRVLWIYDLKGAYVKKNPAKWTILMSALPKSLVGMKL